MSVNEVKLKKAGTAFEVRGTGPLSARTFAIGDEDHTIGNSLRHVLMQNQRINFAAYSVPHPSEPIVHIRVQTVKKATAEDEKVDDSNTVNYPAIMALRDASLTLIDQCDFVLEKLEECIPAVKEDSLKMDKIYEQQRQYADDQEMADDAVDGDGDEEDDDDIDHY
mmetsp:Transcript_40443/g.47319  ORF Transcript_40443/g.47319 Transcript_40443/m.47319 type:complete len:166 (+) Transcript_40443:2-499(+)